jgi:hypothetical protein
MSDTHPSSHFEEAETDSSVWDKVVNVFATPGDVFAEVSKSKPKTANWLVPAILSAAMGVVFALVVFSQPNVQQELKEKQERQFDKMVAAGKIKPGEKERMMTSMAKIGITMMKVTGAVGAVIGSFAIPFLVAAVLTILARSVFKTPVPYIKAVEVAGLSAMILLLGTLVQMLLVLATNTLFVTAGPLLFFRDLGPDTKMHAMLSSVSVTALWYVAVLTIGLAKLARGSMLKASVWLYGLWALWRAVMIVSGGSVYGM